MNKKPSKRGLLSCLALATVLVQIGGVAQADGFKTFLFAFPGASVAWHQGEGLPDPGKGNSNFAFHLESPNNALAGAFIEGIQGSSLTELGFDIRNDSTCTAFAPRYRVRMSGGADFTFSCASGVKTPSPDDPANWTRVSFVPPAGTVASLAILIGSRDTPPLPATGLAHLDNLNINGTLIGKPGENR